MNETDKVETVPVFSQQSAGLSGMEVGIDINHLERRVFEIIPGLLTWATLFGLSILAFVVPAWIAIFLILYDLYWFIRAIYMASHLLAAYNQLHRMRGVDWQRRIGLLNKLDDAKLTAAQKVRELETSFRDAEGLKKSEKKALKKAIWQEKEFSREIAKIIEDKVSVRDWTKVINVVIIPTYKESFAVLKTTLDHLKKGTFPNERLWVAVAFEERAGEQALLVKKQVEEYFAGSFGRLITTLHPDGLLGEKQVKSANATWAAKEIWQILKKENINPEDVLVSNFDSDTCVGPDYFSYLTYVFVTTPDRLNCSYQPLPLYHNNIWHAPAFTRVIATNSAFWQMIEALRPERLVTFSSHSMSFKTLADVGFWETDVVSEDSRIFWQCFLRYSGNYRTIPLFTNVSMDATLAPTLLRTFVNQYKQKRRWAWGIENFPYLAMAFRRAKSISLKRRLKALFIIIEGNHSWATSSLIIALLGWIPIFFGNAQFHQTVLAYNLPFLTRTLATLAMSGLIVTMTLTLLLLPPPPPGTPKRKYVYMILQWALVPVIASVLGSIPAIDAQTRLMIGRPLGFWVTEKARPGEKGTYAK